MSKRKEKIKLGKIYRIEDGSGYAHPGKTYKAYRKKQKYDVVKFTTSKKKAYPLNKNINPNSNEPCFVRKRPERVKAFYPEKKISVDSSCCAGVTPISHIEALHTMKMCHIEVK